MAATPRHLPVLQATPSEETPPVSTDTEAKGPTGRWWLAVLAFLAPLLAYWPPWLSADERLTLAILASHERGSPSTISDTSGGYLCLRMALLSIDRLALRGLVTPISSALRPAQRIYTLTEAGERAARRKMR